MPLYLNESSARKRFKDLLGNANQLLITILVGLSAVEKGLIREAPAELRAAWNPRDKVASAGRSRILVLETTLVRATDALDAYISWARRSPYLIQDKNEQLAIDKSEQSVLKKLRAVAEAHPQIDGVIAALIEVMIAWRNRSVHSLADNTVTPEVWERLQENRDWIKDEFRGMNVDRLLTDFSRDGPPSFKETASFIRATHVLVGELDEHYLGKLNTETFLKDLIWNAVSTRDPAQSLARKKQIQGIWGRDISERSKRVVQFLKNQGLSDEARIDGISAKFEDALMYNISAMPPRVLFEYIRPESSSDTW